MIETAIEGEVGQVVTGMAVEVEKKQDVPNIGVAFTKEQLKEVTRACGLAVSCTKVRLEAIFLHHAKVLARGCRAALGLLGMLWPHFARAASLLDI